MCRAQSNDAHARGARRFDSPNGVFKDYTFGGIDAEQAGGAKVDLGMRFGKAHLMAIHYDAKEVAKRRGPEYEMGVFGFGIRGHGGGDLAMFLKERAQTGYQGLFHRTLHHFTIELFLGGAVLKDFGGA